MMPRKEEPIEPSVLMAQQLMTRLGDYTAIAEDEVLCDNIKALGNTFVSVGDLKLFPEEIAGVFVKCFSQLSVQAPILATLLSLVHQQEGEFSALVTERIGQRLVQAVAEDDVPTAKILLRSVACLSACGSFDAEGPGGLLEVLQGLLDVLMADLADPINADATSALQLSPSAQAATFLLANTLVWAAPSLRTCASSFLSAAQAALQTVVARWCSPYAVGGLQAIFNAFSGAAAEDAMDADGNGVGADGVFETVLSVGPSALAGRGQTVLADGSAWDSLWDSAAQACAVLEELKACTEQGKEYEYPAYMNAQWVVLGIEGLLTGAETKLSFGGHFAAEWAAQLQGLGSRATRCTPAGAVASVLGASSSSAWLRARLTIFDAETSQDCALCCAMSPHAKHVARSYLEDVLTFFDPVVNEDGTLLGSMELLTSHLLAVFKLFPEQAHLEYLLVETLFQLLLQAPTNTALSASVFRLVLELCRRSSQVFPPVVALGANTVFQLVPDLDASSALEFGRWFSFHLINTQLSWPQHYWDFWVGEVAEAEAAGLRTVPLFVRSVVERLSFAVIPDKLRPALPQALHALIPPSGPANCPLLAPSGGESMLSHLPGITALASQLKAQIESKADPEDVTDWLEAQEVPQEDEAQAVCWRGCLLLQVLADVAVSSNDSALSAVVGLLDRYSEPLLVHAASEQDHTDLLHMLREVYGGNNYMHSYLLDEMMRRSQISVCAAAAWLCGPDAAGRARWVSDPLTYGAVASVAERAVDFVKAAVAQRSQLGGGLRLDEAVDLTPSAAPERAAGQAGAGRKRAAEEEGTGAMEAEEDDGDDRHKRSRRGEDAADDVLGSADVAPEEGAGGAEGGMVMDASTPGAAQVEDEDQEDDPLWVADEALKSALRDARVVFATTTGTFRQAIAAPNAEEGADVSYVAASLLRRILRVYRGTERHLSHQQQVAAVLSAPDAQTHALLVQVGSGATGSQAGIAAQRWLAQLQR